MLATTYFIFREKPLKMATEFLRMALIRLDDQQNHEALYYFKQTQYHATEATHTSINFQGLLKSIRMRLVSSTFIESSVEIDGKYLKTFTICFPIYNLGNLCFIPLHCLPERKQKNITETLKSGLDTILMRAGKKTLFGKLTISVKKQDELGM